MIQPTHITSKVSSNTPATFVASKTNSVATATPSKRKVLFLAYYAVVLALVGWKVTDTLFTSAVMVGQKVELRALAQEKAVLEEKLIDHQSTIATAQSLAYFEPDAIEGYQDISNTFTVNLNHYLASR